ncbi:unnamed protein product [Prorocentrum cordatum]|uniref:Magnesium transporter n=1 Tax=Prorocentrum cordatum TaxID=2364126 RepID=A0ABN9WM90_9DINO|nr:unnamed protein product [Polarella glacialis]
MAKADVAVHVLAELADAGALIPEVLGVLRPPVLQHLPLAELVRLVAKLGARGESTDAGLKVPIQSSEGLVRFELFYWNWSAAVFASSVAAGLCFGSVPSNGGHGAGNYLDDWRQKSAERYLTALAAGLIFNVANLCLCKGIAMLGLSLAFPITIGTALVLGTLVTYAVQPRGDFGLLLLGVVVAFAAVCMASWVQRLKAAAAPGGGPSLRRKLAVCLTGGVLMGLWNPLATVAEAEPGGFLTLFTFAVLISSSVLVPLLLERPLEGGAGTPLAVALQEYRGLGCRAVAYSAAGGTVWCVGTLANLVAGDSGVLSSAESYAIGQCANMIAIFWGALYSKGVPGHGPDGEGVAGPRLRDVRQRHHMRGSGGVLSAGGGGGQQQAPGLRAERAGSRPTCWEATSAKRFGRP